MNFIDYDAGSLNTTFEAVAVDQLVVLSGIRVYSLCEHHLLPFWCDVSIGYLTADRVLGASKFARIAHDCAHRLQLQERLVDDIANAVQLEVATDDLAVLARGTHLCMLMRGIRTPATMTTSVMRGAFREDPAMRAELLRIESLHHPHHDI